MKYVSIEDLLEESKASLYSFYDAGLDTALLYGHVARCLGTIGAKILPIKEVILNIENHGCDLPADYSSLISLNSCTKIKYETPVVHGQISYEKKFCHVEPCMNENSYNHDEFGRYKNIYVFENESFEINDTRILRISNDIAGCVNPRGQKNYDAEIKNNQILTQFETGTLFMVYRSSITEGEILIPDYPEIITWLLAEMEVQALRHVLLNTTKDVAQRYALVKQELHIAKENARSYWKRNSLQDFFNLKNYLNRRFTQYTRKLTKNGFYR